MRQKISAFLAALCLLFIPLNAFANLEIKSENIIFYGDVKPEDGERLVRNLETYRAFILSLSGVENRPDRVPLRIYAFETGKALNKFANSRGYAGLYTEGAQGPMFLTVSKGGFKKNKWSSQVALHEYSHHVLHALSKDKYPRWYDEGFANYLSTFELDGDVITIGSPNVNHALSLKQGAWMDTDKVLGAVLRYPSTRRLDKFYGQSWLYVHYLQNTPELSKKLPDYLQQLKTQRDPLRAFKNGFGISPEEFHRNAYLYWNKNTFPVASFEASPELLEHDMQVRTISDAALDFVFAKAKMEFLEKKDAPKLRQKFEDMEAVLGENQELLLMISETAMIEEDYDKAKKYLSKAIKAGDINSPLLNLRADIAYHKLWSQQFDGMEDGDAKMFETNAVLEKTVQYFEQALMLDGGHKETNLHLLTLLGRSDASVSEAGLKAAELSSEKFLSPSNTAQYINVANIMAKKGQTSRACDNYRYAKGRVDGYADKDKNDNAVRLIAFKQKYPDLCA